ncbi:MAG TPA: MogA/MoaB family molybdenum cofactor biosynthesis protein [Tepidisphaeraceae bacterium]|jgi:molybdenum cofactor biosynthesis protein B|nr:MogA/MoaB family molybdenum cofactor biosynthesis protein [Tepidisphaeraceae bacterium]
MSYQEHRDQARAISARCAVITLSDTRTRETDKSGQRIHALLHDVGHAVGHYEILKDDAALLRPVVLQLLGDTSIDVILTTGGTGIAKRDVTVDAIDALLDQPLPGFGELFRMLSWQQIGSGAMMSRAIGGIAKGKVVFAMPGSTAAVELAMTKLILPELPHLLSELRR